MGVPNAVVSVQDTEALFLQRMEVKGARKEQLVRLQVAPKTKFIVAIRVHVLGAIGRSGASAQRLAEKEVRGNAHDTCRLCQATRTRDCGRRTWNSNSSPKT